MGGDTCKRSHKLKEDKEGEPFLCNKCGVMGFGSRHQCKRCNFIMHSHCATCPPTLATLLHPHDQLKLFDATKVPLSCSCNVCTHNIKGIFYHCVGNCGFDAHPLCIKFVEDHPPPRTSPMAAWGHPSSPHGYTPFGGPNNFPSAFSTPFPDYTPYLFGALGPSYAQAYNQAYIQSYIQTMNMLGSYAHLGGGNSSLNGFGRNSNPQSFGNYNHHGGSGAAVGVSLIGGAARILAGLFGVPMM